MARSRCEDMFNNSKSVMLCTKFCLVNTEQYLDQCALDLQVSMRIVPTNYVHVHKKRFMI